MQLWNRSFPSSLPQVVGTRAGPGAMVKFVHVSHKEEALMRKCHSEGMGVRKISALTGRMHLCSFFDTRVLVFLEHLLADASRRCSRRAEASRDSLADVVCKRKNYFVETK